MSVDPWALVLLALLLLTLPLPWVAAALTAAAVHELCHLGAVRLLGGQIRGVFLGLQGARIEAALPSSRRELLAILAGPAGSLALLPVASVFPRLALCGLLQGMFNLLPVEPLDGGRAARLLIASRWPDKAPRLLTLLSLATLAAVTAAAVRYGLPALLILIAIRRNLPRRRV